jgi:hypothetical protein
MSETRRRCDFTQKQLDALMLASGYLRGAGLRDTARVLWEMRLGAKTSDATKSAEQTEAGEHIFPAELTPPVRRILGMMLWETTPIANALRAGGRRITRRCEDEQAAALHWLLGFALEHGMDWEKPAAAALLKMTQGIKD